MCESFLFCAQLHEVVILHTPETKKLSVFDCPGIKTDETASGVLEDDLKKAIDGQVINNYTVIHYFLNRIFDKYITEIIHQKCSIRIN